MNTSFANSTSSRRVVSYLRCSTRGQLQSGLGIEAQRQLVLEYCVRTRSSLVREFVEVESGRKCDREILRQAVAFTKRTRAMLIIAKIDRLARNVAFVANLMETNVQFEACDIAGANNMTIHVMAAVAQNEAEAISKRTKEALMAAKARGTLLGANNPRSRPLSPEARRIGQRRSAEINRQKSVAEYRDLVPIINELKNDGLSLRQIAEQLNRDGHMTRNGCNWRATQVMRVIERTGSRK